MRPVAAAQGQADATHEGPNTTDLSTQTKPRSAQARARTSPGQARAELVVVGFGALMVSMSQSLLVPVLPTLPAELNASASEV
ncbi:hypothetical protein Franean1_0603 [Parafrankia sp. EAN1pec]|uniref:hypothetical protein n=1 Tax=Parafrankia sp. (strain EAN1pec) TaxID=298653 RepID=UPI0000540249|nr:hypothetical protein Franean1_0603 [Frankia sp. EAN1pec]